MITQIKKSQASEETVYCFRHFPNDDILYISITKLFLKSQNKYPFNAFEKRYQNESHLLQLIRGKFDFRPALAFAAFAHVLRNKLESIASDGQKHFDLFSSPLTVAVW